MKKKIFDLSELKVQSFVISVEDEKSDTVKGGIDTINCSPLVSVVGCGTVACTLNVANPDCFGNLNVK